MQTEIQTQKNLSQKIEQASITTLYYYPVKSCGGSKVEEAQVLEKGILHDREFMLIKAATGRFLTQRELPRMALIHPEIHNSALRLKAPGMADLETELIKEGPLLSASVWRDQVESVDQGNNVAEWFSDFLHLDCRLVRMGEAVVRKVKKSYALREEDQVSFADGFPLLLVSEESLSELNRRLEVPVPMDRFRPNIVVAGSGVPFMEDCLEQVKFGDLLLSIVKPCARCPITTTDQETAKVGKEPLKTLASFRRGNKGKVLFGQNVIQHSNGVLKSGDRLEVVKLKKQFS